MIGKKSGVAAKERKIRAKKNLTQRHEDTKRNSRKKAQKAQNEPQIYADGMGRD
jgi:hypothetical protein